MLEGVFKDSGECSTAVDILKDARERIKNRKSVYICLAIKEAVDGNETLKHFGGASIQYRLRQAIEDHIAPWLTYAGYITHETDVVRPADVQEWYDLITDFRIQLIDKMINELQEQINNKQGVRTWV